MSERKKKMGIVLVGICVVCGAFLGCVNPGLDVYFAHPYSPWERGTNENTNGLLRQYLPKSRSFADLTESELASYVWQLNHRPRKCLNYRTPDEVFHQRPVALRM